MEKFPSNSQKSKDVKGPKKEVKPEKLERVTSNDAIRRKKPLGKRFKETFFGGDAKGAATTVVFDVLIPQAKDMMADMMSQGVERMLWGEVRSASRRGARGPSGHTAYHRMSKSSPDPFRREEPRMSRRAKSNHDFDEIILTTRVEAEEVIDRLFDLVSRYEIATVADLYELVGETGSYTDEKWGWSDIRGASVVRAGRSGYLLDLPRPEPID